MSDVYNYGALRAALEDLHRGADAAEFHGSLCGALCVQPVDQVDLLRLVDAGVPARSRAPDLLKQIRDLTLGALQDENLGFMPLLPDDDAPLAQRVPALAAWCGGFLYGLTQNGLKVESLSDDAREIVEDFTQLSRAGLEDEADDEIEETAYAELVEYIRVGAQLVYMELRLPPIADPGESRHLH